MTRYVIAAALFFVLGISQPQAKEAGPVNPAFARGLVDLFDKACVAHAGNLPKLRLWLDVHAKPANEAQSAYFLENGKLEGKAWTQTGKDGNFAILVVDNLGMCTVKAEKANVDDVAEYFGKDAGPKLKMDVKQIRDTPDGSFMSVSGRVVVWTISSGGDDYNIVLSGRQKANVALMSQMSLAAKDPNQQ